MNLYMCWYDDEDWICYVFAETRGKAKYLFNRVWEGEFIYVRSKYIGKSESIETPSVVDVENHKNYPAVLALGGGYTQEGVWAMNEKRICKYCGMVLSEDVPHGLRQCHLHAVTRITELEAKKDILEDQLREATNFLIDKNLHIDSLYEEGYKLQQRIAELEAAQARWVPVSERLPNKSGWYRVGAIDVFDEGYTDEAYFGTMLGWRSPVRDEIYCWLDGVPELPQPPEVK